MSGINPVSVTSIPPVSGRGASSSLSLEPTMPPAAAAPRAAAVVAAVKDAGVANKNPTQQPTKTEINQALEDMIKRGQPADTAVQFSVDEKLDQVVIKVVDPQTNKVIKQFPAEAILKMREEMLAMDSKTPPAGSLLSEKT